MNLGLGADGDLPLPGEGSSETNTMISVPGEGTIEDEMVALQHPTPPRPLTLLSSSAPKPLEPLKPLVALVKKAQVSSGAAAQKSKVLDEYDVDSEDEEDDDYRTTKMEESKTKEEIIREQRGDVEHITPVERKPVPLIRQRQLKLATAAQQVSKVAVKEVAVAEQAPGNDKMMGQCMAFAGWVKSQGSTGPDLVRIWKGTCMPGVMSGDAPPQYGNMCNALGTAVSKFAVRPWEPADLCHAVLQVFKESGVGATPL
jgi:hypothetical protein